MSNKIKDGLDEIIPRANNKYNLLEPKPKDSGVYLVYKDDLTKAVVFKKFDSIKEIAVAKKHMLLSDGEYVVIEGSRYV